MVFGRGASPQPLPVDIHPEPRTVTGLTAEALGLGCKVLGLISGNSTLMDVEVHSLLEGLDIRDQGRVCCSGSTLLKAVTLNLGIEV